MLELVLSSVYGVIQNAWLQKTNLRTNTKKKKKQLFGKIFEINLNFNFNDSRMEVNIRNKKQEMIVETSSIFNHNTNKQIPCF